MNAREVCRAASQLKLANSPIVVETHSPQVTDNRDDKSAWKRETNENMSNSDMKRAI